jgi:hypothetical protein
MEIVLTVFLTIFIIVLIIDIILRFKIFYNKIGKWVMDQITASLGNLDAVAAGIIQALKAQVTDLTGQVTTLTAQVASMVNPADVTTAINAETAKIQAM